jgi:hypothetical protein
MKGIESMLSSMLGISPQQFAEIANQIQTGLVTFAETLVRMEAKQDRILAILERQENDDTSNSAGQPERIAAE